MVKVRKMGRALVQHSERSIISQEATTAVDQYIYWLRQHQFSTIADTLQVVRNDLLEGKSSPDDAFYQRWLDYTRGYSSGIQ